MKDQPSGGGGTPDFASFRIDYQKKSLSEDDVDSDPMRQFTTWLSEAIAAKASEPNAMTVATATRDGRPSARIMLLKDMDEEGLIFFTNYASDKGRALEENPQAALLFFWPELERQVRIEGETTHVSEAESDTYFLSRPPDARLGAVASQQSRPVASRKVLEDAFAELRKKYPDGKVPRPAHWGGYRLIPIRWEFWQGRPSRLHDRIEYRREKGSSWTITRLSP